MTVDKCHTLHCGVMASTHRTTPGEGKRGRHNDDKRNWATEIQGTALCVGFSDHLQMDADSTFNNNQSLRCLQQQRGIPQSRGKKQPQGVRNNGASSNFPCRGLHLYDCPVPEAPDFCTCSQHPILRRFSIFEQGISIGVFVENVTASLFAKRAVPLRDIGTHPDDVPCLDRVPILA